MNAEEQELFEKAMRTIKRQQTQLEDLTSPVHHIATIIAVFPKSCIVDMGNTQFECERSSETDQSWVGTTVQIHPKTGQIVKRSEFVRYGQTASVTQIEGKTIYLNTAQGNLATDYSMIPMENLAVGDRVVLNSTNIVVMKKVELKSKYAFQTQSPLNWDDIGGCAEAKAELRKALEMPYTHANVFNFFHKKRIKGAVLWGRPGMGKTLLGRAAAGAIAKVHKAESMPTGFIYVKGPELLVKWVGDTEEEVRGLFSHAKLHFKQFGYPAVIFIDEADALLTRRGTRTAAGMEQTVVPQFNAEMDGMEDSGAFVLLATNRVDILDPAITRPGRIDRKFHIEAPTPETAPEIFNIHMREVPIAKACSRDQLVEFATKELFSQSYPLYKLGTDRGIKIFTLGNLASGAMIAGLVERATAVAIDRNLNKSKFDGLGAADFKAALDALHHEQFGLNHLDELREFVELGKFEVKGFARCETVDEISKPLPKEASIAGRGIDVDVVVPALADAFSNKDKKGMN